MKDSVDIRKLLAQWPYDPERNLRVVRGEDGRELLQVRQPMGIEQYELEGRPDGQRPQDQESWLDYHLERLEWARQAGAEAQFSLTSDQCAELFQEGTLYYYRYLHLFQMRDWRRTARDTDRNLRLFDLTHRHAAQESDRLHLEQWRPYILRINATAKAMMEMEQSRFDAAHAVVVKAIAIIEDLPELELDTFQFERNRSLSALNDLKSRIARSRPVSELEKLERELKTAVDDQEFERAAILRDRIRELRCFKPPC